MKTIKGGLLAAILPAVRFSLGVLFANPYSVRMGAASLPVVPTGDNELPLTLRVAKEIKRTETVGSLVGGLLTSRDTDVNAEVKTVIKFDADYKARVVVMPSSAADDVVVIDDADTLIGTITRDDATSETSAHTLAIEGGNEANPALVGIDAILGVVKPERSLDTLLNAIGDKLKKLEVNPTTMVFLHKTAGEGSIEIHSPATFGTLVGKIADVTQEVAESVASLPSKW